MRRKLIFSILLTGAGLAFLAGFALQDKNQQPTRVKIRQADELRFERRDGQDYRRLIGNVELEHEGVLMHCDSALMLETQNSFEAFSRVKINSGDTLFLYGEYLKYNGNTRLAEVFRNVKLIDSAMTLTTQQLNYNRNTGIAYYERDGKIVDEKNELTSRSGYYMTEEKRAHFRNNVVLVNPEYVMRSDTLVYHVETKLARFFGPTTIEAENSLIYCENGWYDTENEKAQFNRNAYIISGEHNISGDSLFYDRNNEIAKAFENVTIIDTVQNVILKGNYAEYYKFLFYTFITETPYAIFIENSDSLFMHADTIRAVFNEDQQVEEVKAYYGVKFFRKDIQGMCDSLIWKKTDSLMIMYREPVLWTGENQLTADSIYIQTRGESIETLTLYNSAFIVNRSDTLQFNQVKGRIMTGYFIEGNLDHIIVNGNAQTVYFIKEDDGNLIGVNKALASRMRIKIEDEKIRSIYYFENPDGNMFPDSLLSNTDRFLQGFNWLNENRPRQWTDIFLRH